MRVTESLLVTGFEPFGGRMVNPSGLIVEALGGSPVAGYAVQAGVLPVIRSVAAARVAELIRKHRPAAVVCFGQGGPRQTTLRIERLAANVRDYPIADNAGHRASGEPIIAGAPAAYFATLPVTALRDRVRAAGVPCRLSNSAGTFLCNEVLFAALHHLSTQTPSIPAGFVHVPLLPEQVAGLERHGPSMALETMLRGARAVLAAVAEFLTDADLGHPRSGGRVAPRPRQKAGVSAE
ncbi:MAG: pyroglutamyl-peptidase I [Bacillati bacterium ANGP1]|uniref:Pyroglutamyl-peptidase I n=1 Tax=Candidatus Segetimicrobium genomatis TaxID=2569760 RepID=A0A537J5Y3_9BACT|nr:MAG: pyroglutamyl-peptidase I [Terrabacteria group bacterium ANGP1]